MAAEDRTQNYNDDLKRMSEKLGVPSPPAIETSQISQILIGWGNRIKDKFGLLDEKTKEISRERLLLCNVCDMRSGNTCDPRKQMMNKHTGNLVKGCGCNISAKSMSPEPACPLYIWDK